MYYIVRYTSACVCMRADESCVRRCVWERYLLKMNDKLCVINVCSRVVWRVRSFSIVVSVEINMNQRYHLGALNAARASWSHTVFFFSFFFFRYSCSIYIFFVRFILFGSFVLSFFFYSISVIYVRFCCCLRVFICVSVWFCINILYSVFVGS